MADALRCPHLDLVGAVERGVLVVVELQYRLVVPPEDREVAQLRRGVQEVLSLGLKVGPVGCCLDRFQGCQQLFV